MKLKGETQIFDPLELSDRIEQFPFQTEDLIEKKEVIKAWIEEFDSGKLSKSKEESIKPRFLIDIFDKVLGYNASNPSKWGLTPEFKSLVDGTKPDAALGVFEIYEDNISSRVIAVVEIKDPNEALDLKGKEMSPVEQAFSYAPKSKADWVFVSNFKEIRFYKASDMNRYQRFLLKDLTEDSTLKEFVFLCHRLALMHSIKSRTQQLYETSRFSKNKKKRPKQREHIIDQLDKALKQFDGLNFVDPRIIANIRPFNILDSYVWHYERYCLFTLNPEIYNLLKNLKINDSSIELSATLQKEVRQTKIKNAKQKIEFIFQKLVHSNIFHLSAVKDYRAIERLNKRPNSIGFSLRHIFRSREDNDIISKKIFRTSTHCDCIACNFRNLELRKVLDKLKVCDKHNPTHEWAYGNYLVASNGFVTAYEIYKQITVKHEGKKDKGIEVFLAQYNLTRLYNLIYDYEDEGQHKISDQLKSIDLERILWEDLDGLKVEVRDALRELRDATMMDRIEGKVDELLGEINKVKEGYDRGVRYISIGDYTSEFYHQFSLLYTHVNRNFLIADCFTSYQTLMSNIFDGLAICHTLMHYPYRLKYFDNHLLSEAILNIGSSRLMELLDKIAKLEVTSETLTELQSRLTSFLVSHFKQGAFDVHIDNVMAKYLATYHFQEKCARIFTNTFLLLSKIEFDQGSWQSNLGRQIINFLKVEDYLYWFHLDKFGKFLERNGNVFSDFELVEILRLANSRNRYGYNKYQHLLKSCCAAITLFYPFVRINDSSFLLQALANSCSSDNRAELSDLVNLWDVVGDNSRRQLRDTFDGELDKVPFRGDFYEILLRKEIYVPSYKDYFEKYVNYINGSKRVGLKGIKDGKPDYENFYFYNFIVLVYKLKIPFDDPRLRGLTNLSGFETWQLNPNGFDYGKFEPEWLLAVPYEYFLPRIEHLDKIEAILSSRLSSKFETELAQAYFAVKQHRLKTSS